MQGDQKIINALNKILANGLTAINQFFLHARIHKNWGFHKLDEYTYHQSVREMKNADKLIERILFLEGMPNLQELHKLRIGENVPEMLKCDLELATDSRAALQKAIADCEKSSDYVSRELLEDLLEHQEDHIDWLETQLELLDKVGLQNYLQEQIS